MQRVTNNFEVNESLLLVVKIVVICIKNIDKHHFTMGILIFVTFFSL